jgi:hypothetical protein
MIRQHRIMPTAQVHARADLWIDQIFAAKAVEKGAVIRRDLRWIDREIGRDRFLSEVRQRGFHLIEAGGQWIVICNSGLFRVIC